MGAADPENRLGNCTPRVAGDLPRERLPRPEIPTLQEVIHGRRTEIPNRRGRGVVEVTETRAHWLAIRPSISDATVRAALSTFVQSRHRDSSFR